MRHITALLTAALLALAPLGAEAKTLLRQIERSGMTQQDLNIMVQTGSTLYADGRARPGDETIWSNAETGAFGSIEVTSVSGNCVRLAYKFKTRRHDRVQAVTTRRCLQEGRWILAP